MDKTDLAAFARELGRIRNNQSRMMATHAVCMVALEVGCPGFQQRHFEAAVNHHVRVHFAPDSGVSHR